MATKVQKYYEKRNANSYISFSIIFISPQVFVRHSTYATVAPYILSSLYHIIQTTIPWKDISISRRNSLFFASHKLSYSLP